MRANHVASSTHVLLCEKPEAGKQLKVDGILKNSRSADPLVKLYHQFQGT